MSLGESAFIGDEKKADCYILYLLFCQYQCLIENMADKLSSSLGGEFVTHLRNKGAEKVIEEMQAGKITTAGQLLGLLQQNKKTLVKSGAVLTMDIASQILMRAQQLLAEKPEPGPVQLPSEQVAQLQTMLDEGALTLSCAARTPAQPIIEYVQSIAPDFQLPPRLQFMAQEDVQCTPYDFAELEDRVNEALVGRCPVTYHVTLGQINPGQLPEIFSGRVDTSRSEVYSTWGGTEARIAPCEPDARHTAPITGIARGMWGLVVEDRAKASGASWIARWEQQENRGRGGLPESLSQFLVHSHAKGIFYEKDCAMVNLQLAYTEEGEHCIQNQHRRVCKDRDPACEYDTFQEYLRPAAQSPLQSMFDSCREVLNRVVKGEDAHPISESGKSVYLNHSAAEFWAKLRSAIQTMKKCRQKGSPARACLTFFDIVQDHFENTYVLRMLKTCLEAQRQSGNRLNLSDQDGLMGFMLSGLGSIAFTTACKRRKLEDIEDFAPYMGFDNKHADRQLQLLEDIAGELLVPPEVLFHEKKN